MNDPVQRPKRIRPASARTNGLLLILVVLVILYGSLFPFDFHKSSFPGGPVLYLLGTWRVWDARGDLLANVLLYLPFGFLALQAQPSRFPVGLKLIIAAFAAVTLSCIVEISQFYDAGRVTSMGDVYANLIGAALGGGAAIALGASWRWPLIGELASNPAEAFLLAMFFAYRLFPYVPVIDLHKYWHAVGPVLKTPNLAPGEFLRYFVTWLFIAALVHALYGFRSFLFLFAFLCSAEFVGKIVIIGNELKPADLAGAAGAWLIWSVLRPVRGKSTLLALAFGAMIAIERLQPFRFDAPPQAFGWIPFASLMHGSIAVNIQAFCQKFYEYGGLIWLLCRGGMRPLGSTLVTATLLLATSFGERWLPGRSAEITDAIMALAIGAAFALLWKEDFDLDPRRAQHCI